MTLVPRLLACVLLILGGGCLRTLPGDQQLAASKEAGNKEPSAFGGAKWFMSKEQVKKVFPEAEGIEGDDVLMIHATVFERPADVSLSFTSNKLVEVAISFADGANPESYQSTQPLVEREYGKLNTPVAEKGCMLRSEGHFGRVTVVHRMLKALIIVMEQVVLTASE